MPVMRQVNMAEFTGTPVSVNVIPVAFAAKVTGVACTVSVVTVAPEES